MQSYHIKHLDEVETSVKSCSWSLHDILKTWYTRSIHNAEDEIKANLYIIRLIIEKKIAKRTRSPGVSGGEKTANTFFFWIISFLEFTSRREVLQGPRFSIAPPAALPNFCFLSQPSWTRWQTDSDRQCVYVPLVDLIRLEKVREN